MPTEGAITATVDVFVADPARREEEGAPVKLRLTIWSGPDFKTPTISRGGIFDDPAMARWTAARLVEALGLVGIPVEGWDATAEPLLPPGPEEGGRYERVSRGQAIDRLVRLLDPSGTNAALAAWAAEAKADG